MAVKRALVEAAVLALQDPRVLYPCCRGCFSRIDPDPRASRLSCGRCGYSCSRSLLQHRYRLSVRVARGSCVFGVTVFGNCLNQFFGTTASDLQSLVAEQSASLNSTKSALLVKAVEDCFIGKHFIYGVKVTESDPEPWLENSKGPMAQLIATQMMLPKAAGLNGCTVLSYYEAGLQKATQTQRYAADANKVSKPEEESQSPIPINSPTPCFLNDTLQSSGFVLRPFSRSHLDSSLSPTPSGQQTLGLITSSAEQEESCKDDGKGPCFGEKRKRSPTPLKTWLGCPPNAHKTDRFLSLHMKSLSSSGIAKSILNNSPPLDEFPLSESLTEFLKDRNESHDLQQNKSVSDSLNGNIKYVGKSEFWNESKIAESEDQSKANEDEQLENSIYNCSADLFSNSPSNTALLPASQGPERDLLYKSTTDLSHLTSIPPFPLNNHYEKSGKCSQRNSFQLQPDFSFVPPSQSTPAERITVHKEKILQSNLQIRPKGDFTKENLVYSSQTTLHCCVTPKSRYWNPDKIQHGLQGKKNFRACRGVLNSTTCKRRSRGCGGKDDIIVPPTPTNVRKKSLFKNCNEQFFNVTLKKDSSQTEMKCNSTLSESGLAVDDIECNKTEECDWSKDLFSDSV